MKRLLPLVLVLVAPALFAAEELRLVLERKSLTATWRTYRQFIDGVEIDGTAVVARIDPDGNVHEVVRMLARPGEARPVPRRSGPMIWNAKARVFEVNPVAKLNDPSLRDHNNAASAVPDAAYSIVDLLDLAPSGMLRGPNVTIVDTDPPFTPHADASQPLFFDRSQPQFEEVNAYFHIDTSQRYLQSLGYTGERRLVAYSIPVDPHALSGADNSFYAGGNPDGRGQIYFGDGGTDDAEDSDVIMHEYAHAIQDWIAPGTFGGTSASQSRALAEGFGFYWAFSSTYALTVASGRDPFCIADWDARCFGDDSDQQCGYPDGADCLRRVDSPKTMADYVTAELPGTEHANGEIWASALREIFMALVQQHGLEQGKRMIDTDALEGTFGVPPSPTFNVMARKLLDADRALWGGVHAATICAAMTSRGILAASECGVMPRGELTLFQSPVHGAALPATASVTVTDTRPVDKLLVRVDVEHPSRGDLQITLTAPDGTTHVLLAPSFDSVADVHATFGADAEPAEPLTVFNGKSIAGTWTLSVVDTRGGHAGRLVAWSLIAKFSGDEPAAARPSSPQRQIIAAVAHTAGVGGTAWRSDLFLFNRNSSDAKVTLVYTPSGADGTTNFGAVNVTVAPRQVVAFRDVVGQFFAQGGSGTLEVDGDVQAWSATYDAVSRVGQSIDAVPASDASAGPVVLEALGSHGARTNVGIVETAGASGTASITIFGLGAFDPITSKTVALLPFTHVQIPLEVPQDGRAIVSATGGARVVAYASMIGSDAMYVPARPPGGERTDVIPAAAFTPGANGTRWQTDLWIDSLIASATVTYLDPQPHSGIVGSSYIENFVGGLGLGSTTGQIDVAMPQPGLATSFLYSAPQRRGDTILPLPPFAALGAADAADAIRVENDAAFRTNVGVSEVAGAPAMVRISVLDAAGNELASTTQDIGPRGRIQFGIANNVVDGRVHFEVVRGFGRIVGYVSVVDNASQDAYFVRAK